MNFLKFKTLRFLKYNNSGLKKLVTFSTCFLKVDHNGSRMKRALCMLWLLSSSLVTLFLAGILWAIFCLILLFASLVTILFLFSPVTLLVKFSVEKIMTKINAMTSNSRVVKLIFLFVYCTIRSVAAFLFLCSIIPFMQPFFRNIWLYNHGISSKR